MIGLFFVGTGVTLIIGLIAWYIVNKFVIGKNED
jgi:hypothetical protein